MDTKGSLIKENKRLLKKIIIKALIIRLIALLGIACSGEWEYSFINQGYGVTDDYKYEMGGTLFAENASNLFDSETFFCVFNTVDASDRTGVHLSNPISRSVLWYLIVCFLVWVTETKYSIRLLNIILACISIKYIYNFAEKVWGRKVAYKAAKLFAFLPYPVFFCCFGYKEELALFCTFYLLSYATDYRYGRKLKMREWIKLLLTAILLLGIRSGISLIFLGICFIIMFFPSQDKYSKLTAKKILSFAGMFIMTTVLFVMFGDAIIYKANAYLGGRTRETGTISMLMINSITDVWKLPFSYMFSILMPIGLFKNLDSWSSLIGTVNICMVPISVGAGLYIFLCQKKDKIVYWSTLSYYLIYVVTSLGIFRHYASLLPLNLIFYSSFAVNANYNQKMVMYAGEAGLSLALIAFYLI